MVSSAQRLSIHASAVQALRAQSDGGYKQVKQFQSLRLAQTYSDLLADSRYRDPARFFLHDLYGDKDFSQRDAELQRVIPALQRFLPEAALSTIADAVELDALSEQLDRAVGKALADSMDINFTTPIDCSLERYRQAYVAVNQVFPGVRERQIALVQSIGNSLNSLVRKPLLGGLIKSMGPVAHAAGLSSMHDFLTRGFSAFKAMGDARPFLQIIQSREQSIHQALISQLDNGLVRAAFVANASATDIHNKLSVRKSR